MSEPPLQDAARVSRLQQAGSMQALLALPAVAAYLGTLVEGRVRS